MPEQRLDALARTLAQSTARRSVMRGMAAVGGGLGALAFEPAVPPNAALTAAAPGGLRVSPSWN